jgi:hypothetical protein
LGHLNGHLCGIESRNDWLADGVQQNEGVAHDTEVVNDRHVFVVKLLHHTLDFLLSYDFDLVLFHVKVASLREDFEYRGALTSFHVEKPDVVLWRVLERLDQLPVFVVLVKRISYVHPGDSIALLHFDRNAE